MAWIEGELERTFTVDAPYDEVLAYFQDPGKFKEAFGQMEKSEEIEEGVWHWTLEEKSEKGITFQGTYRVKYEKTDGGSKWASLDDVDGVNMRSEGEVKLKDLGDKTEIAYFEKMASDLPIPKLMAKVFKKIVAREVTSGIGDFLDKSKEILER